MTPQDDAEKKAIELLTLLEDQDGYSYDCNVELIAQALRDAKAEARLEAIEDCAHVCSARWNFLIEAGAKDASITTALKLRQDIRALKGGGK